MNFTLCWHQKEIAETWPKGSVVVCRRPQSKPLSHDYTYILSLYFTPESMSFDKGYEYLLVESPKERKQS
jgi:hypothetical protein